MAGMIFPVAIIALQAGAAVVYGCGGDLRRAIYWAAAVVLTAAVTF